MAVKKKFVKNVLGRGLDDIQTGKGLDALIDTNGVQAEGSSRINEIAIDAIEANPNQPRREFDAMALQELADSIKELGIIQPITLRQMDNGKYQIIAGERRWRASSLAGLKTVPAYIRTINDENVMIEIALAYQHLMDETNTTQEKVAERVGKSRTAVTNYLRLLKLPAQVQMGLQNKVIDMGHARALLALDSPALQIKIFKEIVKSNLSVRKVEELVKKTSEGDTTNIDKRKGRAKDMSAEFDTLAKRLSKFFNTKVQLTCSTKGKGKISIPFNNEEELERIINMMDKIK